MLIRLPLLLLFLFTVLRAGAQAYEPGWLLLTTGDTLHAEVENGFWEEPPTEVRFRRGPAAASELLRPRQLRAFGFVGGRYFRYLALPVDHAADTRLDQLRHGNITDVRTDSLLAEVLLEGPVSVLRIHRLASTHYFLLRADRPPLAMCTRQYLRQGIDGAWQVTDGNNYRGQLLEYFQGCPAAFTATQQAAFSDADLVAVAQAYNKSCSPARQPGRNWLAQAHPRRKVAFRGGLLAGLRYNHIEGMSWALAGPCADCRVRPFGGFYAELLQPSRQSAFYGELSLSRFRSQLVQSYSISSTTGAIADEVFDYRAWLGTARLGIRYFISLRHEQQFLIGFGFELNKVMGASATPRTGGLPRPYPGTEYFYATPTLLPHLGVGWRRQRVTLSLDGQLYRQYGDNDDVTGIFGSGYALRLGLGYGLGRNPDAAPAAAGAAPGR